MVLLYGRRVGGFFVDTDSAIAADDSNTTSETRYVHGNLLANDSAQAGAVLRVGAVQGQESNVGETIVLPSGATVQVNSNGNYTYDPNGAFSHLAGAGGAANHNATDSFTYMLTDGTSATATITVTGGGMNGDRPQGTLGDDVIVGTDAAEFFDLDQRSAGDYVPSGGNGPVKGGNDSVQGDGGPGHDGLFLRGNYAIDFSAPGYSNLLTSVEIVTVTSISDERYARGGGTGFDYDIKFGEAQVGAGGVLTVSGVLLQSDETLNVDGSLETNGAFRLLGGAAHDILIGGAGGDFLEGGLGSDWLTGGGGGDVFNYKSIVASGVIGSDQIADLATGDWIDLSAIDADNTTPANDAFTWIAASAFTGRAGQLRGSGSGAVWTIQGDTDGNGVADFQIVVTLGDGHPIGSNGFVL